MSAHKHSKTSLTGVSIALAVLLGSAGQVRAQFIFGEPENLGPTVNSSDSDWGPSISADGLTLFFASYRPDGVGGHDLWMTTRASLSSRWEPPVNLGPTVNSSTGDGAPDISADGLTLFFSSARPGGFGAGDLWMTTRASVSDPWQSPVNLGPTVNSSDVDHTPGIAADGLTLFFMSYRPGGEGDRDLWMTTRASLSDPWETPMNLGPTVNTSSGEGGPDISDDGLTLFFDSTRPSGPVGSLYMTTRASEFDPWGLPVNLGPTVNSGGADQPSISADGLTLFFASSRPGGSGGMDIWQVAVTPNCVHDLSCDGEVDLDEYTAFHDCLTGPGGGLGAGCECSDSDGSGDVDLYDFADFQESFTGPLP